jgi:hypothetical protein
VSNIFYQRESRLVGWVDKTLDLALTKTNIMSRFKGTRIWPFNPRAMDSKTSFNTLYTLHNQAKEGKEPKQEDVRRNYIKPNKMAFVA